ncbi:MAG TPA: PilZ domain-containing protein [Verrucomicrobiae bacterium]|nr:PilZ domain-containing protein [Verrucomicrobiae bacterium]
MSAKKYVGGGSFEQSVTVEVRQAKLELSADTVVIHKSGIEFRSPSPFKEWSEMTVALQSPRDGSKLQCAGVVIVCSGNKHGGYRVSMVFTSLSKQAQMQLNMMARSDLGVG